MMPPVTHQDAPESEIEYKTDLCTLQTVECEGERKMYATITAYNSIPDQTDASPCITASGLDICKSRTRIIANNCLKFGTKVVIEGHVYDVQDRLNARYGCDRMDIWLESHEEAKKWGVQRKLIIILYGNDRDRTHTPMLYLSDTHKH